MEIIQKIALFFTIIGGINWGLIGFFDFNLVTTLFGNSEAFVRIIYGFIGICALINIRTLFIDFREVHNTDRK